jgi:hypothetical protein
MSTRFLRTPEGQEIIELQIIGYNLEEQARLTRYQRAFLVRGVGYYTSKAFKQANQRANETVNTGKPGSQPRRDIIDPVIRERIAQQITRRPRRKR